MFPKRTRIFRTIGVILSIVVLLTSNIPVFAASASETSSNTGNSYDPREENINSMLNTLTLSDNVSYWTWFSDTTRYPSQIYLENYYGANDNWGISLFRNYVAPSIIMLADKTYNDGVFSNQSETRAKQILLSLIDGSKEEWFNNEELNNAYDDAGYFLDNLNAYVESNPAIFEAKFDSDYEKLDAYVEASRQNLFMDIKNGTRKFTPELAISECDKIGTLYNNASDKEVLIKNLENDLKEQKRLEIIKKAGDFMGTTLDAIDSVGAGLSTYQDVNTLLSVDQDYLDFLSILETSKTSEVAEAARELKETYKQAQKDALTAFYKGVIDGGLSYIEGYLKDENAYVSIAKDFADYVLKVGDKIDAFEKLRLSSAMSTTLDKELTTEISSYQNPSSDLDKEEAVETIYKYAPYVFALREESESDLCEYVKFQGGNSDEVESNLNSVKSGLKTLYNTLYSGFSSGNNVGNTPGNIQNGGWAAIQGDWIYYANSDDGDKIYKIKTNDSDKTKINDDSSRGINVVGDWIYYANSDDGLKIYKIKTDGNNRTKIADDTASYMNVVDDWIYYFNISDNGKIYKVKTDGSSKTKINDEPNRNADFVNNVCLNVIEDWIYYINQEGGLYKIRIDGGNKTKIIDECYEMNVVGDWIYYRYQGLYKIKTDVSNNTKISDTWAPMINVTGDWIYFYDQSSICKIKTDGSSKIELYHFNDGPFPPFIVSMNVVGDWVYCDCFGDEDNFKMKTDGSNKMKLE